MKFLALPSSAGYALLAGVALVVLLLYLLKLRPPRIVVASALLWARVLRSRKRANTRWRWLLSLLLSLAAALSIALAITRPVLLSSGAAGERLVLIVDNSPSMAARTQDGRSRWEHAVARARTLLEQSATTSEVMLADTMGQAPPTGFTEREAALAALARLSVAAGDGPRLPVALSNAGARVHFFTDGVARLPPAQGTVVHSVFEPADNVAVTAFQARPLPLDPTRYQALVQVLNASPRAKHVRLLIRGGKDFAIAQDLDLSAAEMADAVFDISAFEGGVLGAAVATQGDAFPLDDIAYTVVPLHAPQRVLLVTPGNAPLADSLRALPGMQVTIVSPQAYSRAGAFDAYVFDRFAPAQPPARGALLFAPPGRQWLPGRGTDVHSPAITGFDEGHPAIAAIAWRDLRVGRASLDTSATLGPATLVLAHGPVRGALVTAGQSPSRWIKVGFAVEDSNLPLQPGFPVFLGDALRWVTAATPVFAHGLGSIEVAVRDARVRDGSGKAVAASPTADGTVFTAPRPEVYTVSGSDRELLVVAGVMDPDYARINRSRLDGGAAVEEEDGATARFWTGELWTLLLVLAVALLLLEWVAFTRRLGA